MYFVLCEHIITLYPFLNKKNILFIFKNSEKIKIQIYGLVHTYILQITQNNWKTT